MTWQTSKRQWKTRRRDARRRVHNAPLRGERVTIMDCNIYCLVDASGHVYVKDGAVSHEEVAANFGLDAQACDTYRFDLAARHLLVDRGTAASDRAARTYCDQHVGSPDKLMTFAAEGRLTKQVLGNLLGIDDALAYL